MPGPASHLIIMEEQIKRIRSNPTTFNGPLLEALDLNGKEAALGAIGPDMIFWADWGEFTPLVNTVFDVYKTIDEVYEALSAIWNPISEHVNKVVDSLSGGVASEIQETATLVQGLIESALLELITDHIDVLDFLKPDFQTNGSGSQISDWNWLDYTHNRWTGEFSRTLIQRAHATGRSELRAYAYGWLSHVVADTVGHPYVNTAVGGPYRCHWVRHFVQEKFMDTWVWGYYKSGSSMPSSPSPGSIPFNYASWPNINGSNLHKLIDLGNDLPGTLQDVIVDSLNAVYRHRPHPNVGGTIPFLDRSHINRAYQMLLTGLEIMTSKERAISRPEPPPFFNDDAFPTFPLPGGGSGGSSGSGGGSFSLVALLLAIFNYIRDLFEYVNDLVLWLISQVTTPLTFPIRYGLYLLQLTLYEIYRQYRWALALSGFTYPDPDQLPHPLAQQFVNPQVDVQNMPRRQSGNPVMFPATSQEPPPATSGPYTRWPNNYPYWFIEGEPLSSRMVEALTNAATPERTMALTRNLFPGLGAANYSGSLGNSMDLYLRYATQLAQDGGDIGQLTLPDWNLDGDRGYGFKCWRLPSGTLEPPPASGVNGTYSV